MKILVCFVLLSCCVAIVAAQERVIDKTEFDAVVAEGNKILVRRKGEKYRMTITTSAKIIGRTQNDWSSKAISEFGSDDQTRHHIYASTFGGKARPTTEAIVFGKWEYKRAGTDPWSRKAYEAVQPQTQVQPEPLPENPFQVIETVADYRYLGKQSLGAKQANVYQKIERQNKVNKKNGENTESETKATYWFTEDGTMFKNEHRSSSRSATMTTQNLIILEWALDPSIVISEPVLEPAKP
jgi:hypothetical protein